MMNMGGYSPSDYRDDDDDNDDDDDDEGDDDDDGTRSSLRSQYETSMIQTTRITQIGACSNSLM